MVHITSTKLMPFNRILKCHYRKISKYLHREISSKVIRQKFLDYFIIENEHTFVKSSPVVPLCDPTVAFVNAGMNQFKGIFLGTQSPQFTKVANSQKCIRVGGKHNDLNTVGSDGYHHTFFEMLGSWSFGDYFKEEACLMAWELLTHVYKLPPSRLYVTYFKGDEKLGLGEDIETKEMWKKIGVPIDRILPFGSKENFWEMGLTGPCGPCTEIHIDHRGTSNRAKFVNKGLHDLTEIWNIVFIEYNRNPDGSIILLPQKHVDTGMGFERLTAILQGKVSNYDTDIFQYLLTAIQKNCSGIPKYGGKFGESDWNSLDSSYRILADHARMITACLADGIIPEQNQKLRRLLRKSFLLSESVFKKDSGLLKELTNYVVEHLGPVYPEMEKNVPQVHQIIDYEEEIYKTIRKNASKDWDKLTKDNPKLLTFDILECPSVIQAYKEISTGKLAEITPEFAFKLYDTHGLDEDVIEKLSKALDLKFDAAGLVMELEKAKLKSKEANIVASNTLILQLIKENLNKTNDTYKYDYDRHHNTYRFKDLEITVLKIVKDNEFIKEIKSDVYCSLLLDKTSLYSEAGGQATDRGVIHFNVGTFDVVDTENIAGYILHSGFFNSDNSKLTVNSIGILKLDSDVRQRNMRNHTATHLLNATLKALKGATCQKSSKVNDSHLNFDVAIFGNKLTTNEIATVERNIVDLIEESQPVVVNEVNSQQLLGYDSITLIPGEIYPDSGIRIVEIQDDGHFISREPCCGTHVQNTADLNDFCIIVVKSLGRSTTSISAVTGDRAILARSNACEVLEEITNLQKNLDDNIDKPQVLDMAVMALKQKLNFNVDDPSIVPAYIKHDCLEKLEDISRQIKETARGSLRDFIEIEMQNALESNIKQTKSNKNYIIHYLRSSMILESVPLQRATKLCPDLPIMVISYADNMVKARCCVPKNLRSENFNAEKWLKETVANVFKSRAAPPKGKDGSLVCNMKAKRVHLQEWDTLLNESLEAAEKYVDEHL